jgi:hypothetical protein
VIAETIVAQLGGFARLKVMIGASQFVSIENGVQFSYKGDRKSSKILIRLDPSDTYTVQFWAFPRSSPAGVLVREVSMVYADSLKSCIETQTGLRLSLFLREL